MGGRVEVYDPSGELQSRVILTEGGVVEVKGDGIAVTKPNPNRIIYRHALAEWREANQIRQALEELNELEEELVDLLYCAATGAHPSSYHLDRVREEIVDVEIMLGQLREMWTIGKSYEATRQHKLDRLAKKLGLAPGEP